MKLPKESAIWIPFLPRWSWPREEIGIPAWTRLAMALATPRVACDVKRAVPRTPRVPARASGGVTCITPRPAPTARVPAMLEAAEATGTRSLTTGTRPAAPRTTFEVALATAPVVCMAVLAKSNHDIGSFSTISLMYSTRGRSSPVGGTCGR